MSRGLASRFQTLLTLIVAVGGLTSCGGSEREAPVPPPITASKPTEASKPAPAAATSTTGVARPAESTPAPTVVAAAPASPAPEPAPAPASTPNTSLPGAIPPAPLPDPSAPPPEQPVDPLQRMRDSQARKAEYQRAVGEADADVVNANAKVAEWEKNVLAFANPFLARPQLSPEDASAIAGMGGAARMEWAKAKLADARAARDASQKALDTLKANPPLY